MAADIRNTSHAKRETGLHILWGHADWNTIPAP
jgi:hypothetical protein